MKSLCAVDGRILPLAAATISPLDRGFLFGDGVYEVAAVKNGQPLFLEAHLARLGRSLAAVAIPPPADAATIDALCRDLLERSGLRDGSLYLQVTRGVAPRSHFPPVDLQPTFFVQPSIRRPLPLAPAGWRAISVPDERWQRCDVKTTSMMGTILGKLAARDAGVDEALFAGPAGELREGGSTSFLVWRRGRLETHPADQHILPGITRQLLLDLAAREGWEVVLRPPQVAEREQWEEAVLCGTVTTVQGLVELDGQPIGDGAVGVRTRALATLLAAAREAEVAGGRHPTSSRNLTLTHRRGETAPHPDQSRRRARRPDPRRSPAR